jgi:hypothetical protein
MPDDKKTTPEQEQEAELTRRQLFVKVGLGSIALARMHSISDAHHLPR